MCGSWLNSPIEGESTHCPPRRSFVMKAVRAGPQCFGTADSTNRALPQCAIGDGAGRVGRWDQPIGHGDGQNSNHIWDESTAGGGCQFVG